MSGARDAKGARAERNRIRAHYEQKFSARLKEKDQMIQDLLNKNSELSAQVASLQEQLRLEKTSSDRLSELVKQLQQWTELSDSELEKVRAGIQTRHDAARHIKDMKSALNAMAGTGPYAALAMMPEIMVSLLEDLK